MRAHRCGQELASGVGHGEAGLQRVVIQREGNFEAEREWVDRARLGVIAQYQTACGGAAVQPGKAPVAGEAVLDQVVRPALVQQPVILQTPDDGEQHRRVARPDRVRLPKHLLTGSVTQRTEFRTFRLHRGGERSVRQHVPVHHRWSVVSGRC